MARRCINCLTWLVLLLVFVLLIHYWISNKSYMIDEKELGKLVFKHTVKSANGDPTESYKAIIKALQARYPGHILAEKDQQWLWMNAGGWMGAFKPLHCSLTEYIILFGFGLESSGHSGRYWANITDYIIAGEVQVWEEGTTNVKVYKAGEAYPHPMGSSVAFRLSKGTWGVEYGRGFAPSTLTMQIAGILFNTQDFYTFFMLVWVHVKAMMLELGTAVGVALV